MQEELSDLRGQAHTLDSLGYARHHLGHHEQAAVCYRRALTLFRELGDRYYEAGVLDHLGDTSHAVGDPAAARTAWQAAREILRELSHSDAAQIHDKLCRLDGDGPGAAPAPVLA